MTSSEDSRLAHRDRSDWAATFASLRALDAATPLDPDRLERLAIAAYLSGHDHESTDAWSRCYRRRLERDEPEAALRCAFWLGLGLLERGDVAQGSGWMGQAGQLAAERDLDCVECGYLLVPGALMSLHRGAHADAFEQFEAAGRHAERFDDDDLRALSCLGRGQALGCMGRWRQAVALFDQAMAAVTSGVISPIVSGIVYCAVVDQCQGALDVRRSHEWTAALTRWCERQPGLVPYRGQCLVHRSHVLRVHGEWIEAAAEAELARDRLVDPPHPAAGMAHYELGELHRLRGEYDEAESEYRRAHELGRHPQPGLALLRLAQDQLDAAAAAIDAALAGADDAFARARLLPAFVQVMLAADRVEVAREAADELATAASSSEVEYLEAAAAHAAGAVSLAAGDPRAALRALRTAWIGWQELELPYEAARTQLLVAEACSAIGDEETARFEADAAREAFASLGALPDVGRVEALYGSPGGAPTLPVSPREQQVLRRVARGMTNRDIANDLFISIKTVERHLSNIFAKLDVANRAEATARAYDRQLL